MPRWSAERRTSFAEGRETPRKRLGVRKRTPQRCLASTERHLGAPLPSLGREGPRHYGAPGAAKHTGGGALAGCQVTNARGGSLPSPSCAGLTRASRLGTHML